MGDSRLRELERRWQEAETPASWTAYLQEQIRTGTGVVPAAEAFLEGCLAFAETLAPDWRALVVAHVAWAYLDLGQDDWALELALSAEEETGSLIGCAALTRVAAVAARQGMGHARFNDALDYARVSLENNDLTGPRHFVVTLLEALEDVGPEAEAAVHSSLLRSFLEAVPLRLIVGFGEAIVGLSRLGMGELIRGSRSVVDPDDRAAHGLVSEGGLERRFRATNLGVLALLGHAEDAERLFEWAVEQPDLVGAESVTAFRRAFGACADPHGMALELRGAFAGTPLNRAWIGVAFLEWAEASSTPLSPIASEWLDEVLAAARQQPMEGALVEQRALPLVVKMWPKDRAVMWLRSAVLETLPTFFKPGLLGVVAQSLAELGRSSESATDLDRVITTIVELTQEPELGGIVPYQVMRALSHCAESAGVLELPEVCDRIETLTTAFAAEWGDSAALDVARVRMSIAIARIRSTRAWTAAAVRSRLGLIRASFPLDADSSLLASELAVRAQSLAPGARPLVGRYAVELLQHRGRDVGVGHPSYDEPRDAVDALGALCRDLVGRERSA